MPMPAHEQRPFPRWETLYQEEQIESMPWFTPALDDDLAQALDALGLRGGSALDLGTGPGTQAMHFAQMGFRVTDTDISGRPSAPRGQRRQHEGLPSHGPRTISSILDSPGHSISFSTAGASTSCRPSGGKSMSASSGLCCRRAGICF